MEANLFMLAIVAIFFGFYLYFRYEDKKYRKKNQASL